MDVCGSTWNEGRNSSNAYDSYCYGSDSSPQYIPTFYGSKQNSVQVSYNANQSKRNMDESAKQPAKHQQVSTTEEDEKQFVL